MQMLRAIIFLATRVFNVHQDERKTGIQQNEKTGSIT